MKTVICSVTKSDLNNKLDADDAIRILRQLKRDVFFLEPLSAMESPIEPENGKGLTMIAFDEDEAKYSPFSILDPKSLESGFWDVILGIEETIYLPIKGILIGENKEDIGVLCISWDSPNLNDGRVKKNFCYEKIQNLLNTNDNKIEKVLTKTNKNSLKDLIEFKDEPDEPDKPDKFQVKTYNNFDFFSVDKIEGKINNNWKKLLKDKSFHEGLKLLDILTQNTIKRYKQNLIYFDDMIIDLTINPDIKQLDNELWELARSIHSFNCDPIDKIREYIHNNRDDIATVKYYEKLQNVEPLLQSIGTKDHYIHGFNVFLLGNILYKYLFNDKPNDNSQYNMKIWREIALSHDLAYPIETIKDELKSFFEVYFYKGKTPDIHISKSLYFCYNNFTKELPNIIEKASELLSTNDGQNKYQTYSILEDLVIYSLYERSDHAVLSSLFTIHSIKSENDKYQKAVPILLHNLYQWKYYILEELGEIETIKNNNNIVFEHKNGEIKPIINEKFRFTNFIYEKRIEKDIESLNAKKETEERIKDEFYKLIKDYANALKNIHIIIDSNEDNQIKKYTFLLALSDFIQEWGRFTDHKKGLIALGLRIGKIEKNVISLSCPYIRKNKRIFNPDKGSTKMLWKCLYLDENVDPEIDKDFLNLFKKTHLYKCDNIYKKIWNEIDQEIEDHIKQHRSWKKKREFNKSMNYATLALTELLIKKYLEFQYKFLFNKIGGKIVGLFDFNKDFMQIEFEGLRYNEETCDCIKIPK